MMSESETGVGGRQARRVEHPPQREKIVLLHMRQDDVLLVADAQFAEAEFFAGVGEHAHLLGSGVAGDAADGLQRNGDDGVAGRSCARGR